MNAFSFIKKYADHPKYISPVGTKLNTKSWQTEAPLRMFLNNLNVEVAEDPKNLIVYGGSGKAARDVDSAKKIIEEFSGNLPSSIEELKTLPGIGDYTSRAIMAIVYNKSIIPLDGNVERVLKRIFFLKKKNEITKNNINKKKSFFGSSNRAGAYAQAIMEIGALVCKPKNPLCYECPISKSCKSYKRNDFKLRSKNKFNKIKYFEANIYQNQNKYLLIKNKKFKFLKNLLIFPMKEVKKNKFYTSINKKINIKMSNMDMKIVLNEKNKFIKIRNSCFLDKKNIKDQILPSFTKKIFNSISNHS